MNSNLHNIGLHSLISPNHRFYIDNRSLTTSFWFPSTFLSLLSTRANLQQFSKKNKRKHHFRTYAQATQQYILLLKKPSRWLVAATDSATARRMETFFEFPQKLNQTSYRTELFIYIRRSILFTFALVVWELDSLTAGAIIRYIHGYARTVHSRLYIFNDI